MATATQPTQSTPIAGTPFTPAEQIAAQSQNTQTQNQQFAAQNPTATQPAVLPTIGAPTMNPQTGIQAGANITSNVNQNVNMAYGAVNTNTPQAQPDLSTKYNAALQSAQSSGTQPPSSLGQGMAGVQSNLPQTPAQDQQAQAAQDQAKAITAQLQADPGYQQLVKDQQAYLSTQNQTQTLQQQYDSMMQSAGVPALNTQLLNMKNIMDGTEQDIRNEVTKAGGFATESQVLALTNARNKTMIQNYNNLLNTKTDLENQIKTSMGFAQQDQANATALATEKLNFDKQIIDYQQKMTDNAKSAYQKIIDTPGYGYKALYASTGGDAHTASLIEQTLGLPNGYLKTLASQPDVTAQKDALQNQLLQAQIASAQATARKTNLEANALAPISPNDPSVKAALDPNSQSILAQTGLSVAAFNYLTQGTTALSRLSSADRQKIMNEAGTFLNKNGLDYSTFQSQYKAQNDVVQQNIQRATNTKIYGGEVSGTVTQFINDIGNEISNLKPAAVTDLFLKGQTNDPTAQKYAFDLQTMQNDLAGYYAASRGATQPDQADLHAAANVITQGLSKKGAQAFKSSIDSNVQKVSGVVNEAVTNAQQSVWNQFGVGSKFKPTTTQTPVASSSDTSHNVTAKGLPFDYQGAINAGWSPTDIGHYLNSH